MLSKRILQIPLDKLEVHPEAELVPLMTHGDLRQLVESVKSDGITHPLHVIPKTLEAEEWVILDGRHRLRAAEELSLAIVPCVEVELEPGQTSVAYMMKAAVNRRHLTDDQRAILANELRKALSAKAVAAGCEVARASQRKRQKPLMAFIGDSDSDSGDSVSGNMPETPRSILRYRRWRRLNPELAYHESTDKEREDWYCAHYFAARVLVLEMLDEGSSKASIYQAYMAESGGSSYNFEELFPELVEKGFIEKIRGRWKRSRKPFSLESIMEGKWKGTYRPLRREDGEEWLQKQLARVASLLEEEPEKEPEEQEESEPGVVDSEPAGSESAPELEKPKKRDTRREANETVGLPPESRKTRDIARIEKEAPEQLDAIRTGEKTIKEVKRELRKEKQKEQLEEMEAAAAEARASSEPLGEFLHLDFAHATFPEADLVFSDHPYGRSKSHISHKDRKSIDTDFGPWDGRFDCSWVSSVPYWLNPNTGQFLCFTPVESIGDMEEAVARAGLTYRGFIIWHKTNPGTLHRPGYLSSVEAIVWATMGNGHHFTPWPNAGDRECHNFIEGPICQGNERLSHPTQKPLWLLERLLKRHAKPGQIVVDPFAGVASILKAAESYGCRYFGTEIEEGYHQMGMARLHRVKEVAPT